MRTTVTIVRFFVGLLFIFSGLVKANDPLGLSYKIQEFFEIWGLHSLNEYTLALSLLLNAFEVIAGVALLIRWLLDRVTQKLWLLWRLFADQFTIFFFERCGVNHFDLFSFVATSTCKRVT